ncbi:MAG: SprT family zinc-dependent metalloprotease [Halobacteriales archaeon]|nr:SprT family zinc-dependent metalloprotease [Halobacteriales archaeon]
MTQAYQYHIGQTVVPYGITWVEGRGTIGLRIDESMEMEVRAPMSASLSDVEAVLDDRQDWILEKLYGLAEQADTPRGKEFLSGEKLRYRGRQYPLKVVETGVQNPELSFDGDEFKLGVHSLDAPSDDVSVRRKRGAVVDWYERRASEELPERAERFAPKVGASDVEVEVGEPEDKWGVYEDGNVSLNWRLVLAPVRIQDYVAVHELAHAVHDEHTESFWNTVGALIPDYEKRREWLRLNGNTLTV